MEKTFDFDTIVSRADTGNLKDHLTPVHFKANGVPSFNAAEMDFKTAPSVIKSMQECVENGLFGFTLPDERFTSAVCWWMQTQRGAEIKPEWIVPTHGTIFSVATCIRMVTEKNERIIVQPPIYNRYKQAADRLGRETVFTPLLKDGYGGYEIDFTGLEKAMSDPQNKLLILCNPHNPLGRVWDQEEQERIAELALKYNVLVYSDEIFADYGFDGCAVVPYFTINNGQNNGITATSLGKTFNFTGVNQANMIIPDTVLRERFVRQRYSDHYGSLDPVARAAILGAYCKDGAAWKDAVHDLLWNNYRYIIGFFEEHFPQVKISPLQGGYVIWMDWRGCGLSPEMLDQIMCDAMFLLDDGTDYCITEKGYYRMNIATTPTVLRDALKRLRDIFK